jgi:hypothetical protein
MNMATWELQLVEARQTDWDRIKTDGRKQASSSTEN